jgi:hypothetical protein
VMTHTCMLNSSVSTCSIGSTGRSETVIPSSSWSSPNESVRCRLANFPMTAREIPDTREPGASQRPATEEHLLLADKKASDDTVFTIGFGICDASILTDPSLSSRLAETGSTFGQERSAQRLKQVPFTFQKSDLRPTDTLSS